MNQTLKELSLRKSVRVYTEQKIDDEIKKEILMAAMQAPTAGNQQLYTILDITDPQLKTELSETCDHQSFIASAPMMLVFCADVQKWYDIFCEANCSPRRPGPGNLFIAFSDALIAAQNAVVAAESLGIGSCYIGDIIENYEITKELLNLPEYVFPAAMAVFGYPTEQQKKRTKPERCRPEDIVCENHYHRKNGAELRRMMEKECRNDSFENWAQKFCARKHNSDFAAEMNRSAAKYFAPFSHFFD